MRLRRFGAVFQKVPDRRRKMSANPRPSRFLARLLTAHGLHSLCGFSFSLFLVYMFLTGTLLVFAPELDWLRYSEMRVAPQAGEKIGWGAVYDAAAQARPEWNIVGIERAAGARVADKVIAIRPGRPGDQFIWINPYTAGFRGVTAAPTIQSTLLQMHERVFISGRKGKFLATFFTLPLTAAVVAGLFLYGRFWQGYLRWPRFGRRSRAWLSDLHRLIAVWSLPFLAFVIVTSLWYFIENLGLEAPLEPQHQTAKRDQLLPDFDGAKLDRMAGQAVAALPGLNIGNIVLPRRPTQTIIFQGDLTANLVRVRANAVHFNPQTLAMMGAHRGEEMSFFQRISEAADPLHYGLWGGLVTRIFWVISGLGLTALATIGVIIHAKRLVAQESAVAGVPVRRGLVRLLRDMGPYGTGAAVSVALVLIGLGGMVTNLF